MSEQEDKRLMAMIGWPVIVGLTLAGLFLTTRSFWDVAAYGETEAVGGSIWSRGEVAALFVGVAVVAVLVAAVLALVRQPSEGLVAGQFWPLRISAATLFVAAVALLVSTGSPPGSEDIDTDGLFEGVGPTVNAVPVAAALLLLTASGLAVLMHTSRRW